MGLEIVRKHVAEYISRRDAGIPSSPNDVFLCAGASDGIRVNYIFVNAKFNKINKGRRKFPRPSFP